MHLHKYRDIKTDIEYDEKEVLELYYTYVHDVDGWKTFNDWLEENYTFVWCGMEW